MSCCCAGTNITRLLEKVDLRMIGELPEPITTGLDINNNIIRNKLATFEITCLPNKVILFMSAFIS